MEATNWSNDEISKWINSQSGPDYWYQRIQISDTITTPGTVDPSRRLELINLPDDLSEMSVLDVGCNSGMLCIECKRRYAERVVGIDLQTNRLNQAKTLAEIMNLDIEYKYMNLFDVDRLGQFDIVFCIAVVTEVTDLISALNSLKQVTGKTLFLELAVSESFKPKRYKAGMNLQPIFDFNLDAILRRLFPTRYKPISLSGISQLRKIDSKLVKSWSLVPDMMFISSIFGGQFQISDLGPSSRYQLLKIERV